MRLIIDTSILIDYLRGGMKWEQFLTEIEEDIELFLPTVVIFELFSGKSSRVNEKAIIRFVGHFKKVDFTETIAKRAGELYRDINQNLEVPDYIVAASALEIGGIVVTLNKKHFKEIPHLKLFPIS